MLRGNLVAVFSIVALLLISGPSYSADYSCTNCFSEVSAGESHTCAIREDGSLTCWGYDFFGQADVPELNREYYDFVQVSSGGYHTCAVVECTPPPGGVCLIGNGLCWGNDDEGQAGPQPGVVFDHISAGRYHTCGLTTNNQAVCWGSDTYGQSTVPSLGFNVVFLEIAAGGYHSCGILGCLPGYVCMWPGNVRCWGSDGWGQAPVSGLANDIVQLSAGLYHNCGVRETGDLQCWGRDDYGQSAPPSGISFERVASGGFHTCGLSTTGEVHCWGRNDFGQAASPSGDFTSVSAGAFHSCAAKTDGEIVCWGSDLHSQTVPTAGHCGLFDGDFEVGGDCRWSTSSSPCWTFDCDDDGFAPYGTESRCEPTMPVAAPPGCPFLGGSWIDQAAACGQYDCMDENPYVFYGDTTWWPVPYNPGGQHADRFDFNCDGVDEKQFQNRSTNLCCATVGGPCLAMTGPGCDAPGWDTATVSKVPACGETADYLTCETTKAGCVPTVSQQIQYCR